MQSIGPGFFPVVSAARARWGFFILWMLVGDFQVLFCLAYFLFVLAYFSVFSGGCLPQFILF